MANELQIFKNPEFGSVRTMVIEGEPWFVGKDVAEILGYVDTYGVLKKHVDEEDKQNCQNDSFETPRGMMVINESGLYSLVLGSKLLSAKKFKRWITSDVLPSIRKHGMYAKDELLNNPDLLIRVAQKLKEERERNKALKAENDRMKPKEIFADAVSASDTSMLIRDVAKILKQNGVALGEKRFYHWLRQNGYICKGSTSPTQKAMELGLFEIVVRTVERGNGLPIETKTTKVTGKGQQYFINKFLTE